MAVTIIILRHELSTENNDVKQEYVCSTITLMLDNYGSYNYVIGSSLIMH